MLKNLESINKNKLILIQNKKICNSKVKLENKLMKILISK